MGTDIRSNTANPAANMVAAPGYVWDAAGHTGIWWLGAPTAKAAKNRASLQAAAATIIGTPVEKPYYLTFGGAGGGELQTALMETTAITLISVCRMPVGVSKNGGLIGNYSFGQTIQGLQLIAQRTSAGALRWAIYYNVTADGSTPVAVLRNLDSPEPVDQANWHLVAAVITPGVGAVVYDRTGVQEATLSETRARLLAARPLRIGRQSFTDEHDQAFVGIVPAALTKAQIDAAMVKPRLFLSEIAGITV